QFHVPRRVFGSGDPFTDIGQVDVANLTGNNTETPYSFSDTGVDCTTKYEYVIHVVRESNGQSRDSASGYVTTGDCASVPAETATVTTQLNKADGTDVAVGGSVPLATQMF